MRGVKDTRKSIHKTPNTAPTPPAAPLHSPSKETLKRKLETTELKLQDAKTTLKQLRQGRDELDEAIYDLEMKVMRMEDAAEFSERYIKTMEELVKDEHTLEGPQLPSNVWEMTET